MIDLNDASNIFKALSDVTRIRVCRLLVVNQTAMCVCELVDSLKEQQYNVSKQVKILEASGLLEKEKEGRWIYYSIKRNREPLIDALNESISLIEDSERVFSLDQKRFESRMQLRENGRCNIGLVPKE